MQERVTATGTTAGMKGTTGAGGEATRQLLTLGVAVLVAAAVVAWLAVRRESTPKDVVGAGPALVSADELRHFAASVGHPVFWAGPRVGSSYELTATPSGRVFVRYLPANAAAGDTRTGFLTVGTYPMARPYADLERAARADDAVGIPVPGGALALMSRRTPTSVYLARRGFHYQVEVYDASLDTARDLVLSGSIRPVR